MVLMTNFGMVLVFIAMAWSLEYYRVPPRGTSEPRANHTLPACA